MLEKYNPETIHEAKFLEKENSIPSAPEFHKDFQESLPRSSQQGVLSQTSSNPFLKKDKVRLKLGGIRDSSSYGMVNDSQANPMSIMSSDRSLAQNGFLKESLSEEIMFGNRID